MLNTSGSMTGYAWYFIGKHIMSGSQEHVGILSTLRICSGEGFKHRLHKRQGAGLNADGLKSQAWSFLAPNALQHEGNACAPTIQCASVYDTSRTCLWRLASPTRLRNPSSAERYYGTLEPLIARARSLFWMAPHYVNQMPAGHGHLDRPYSNWPSSSG